MDLGKLSSLVPSGEEREKTYFDVLKRIGEAPGLLAELQALKCPEEVLKKSYPLLEDVLVDRKPCQECLSYAFCPKEGREGSVRKWKYLPYLGQIDLVSADCPKKAKVLATYRNFVYSSVPLFGLYKTSSEVLEYFRKISGSKKTSFGEHSFARIGSEAFVSYAEILKGKEKKGLYLSCPNGLAEKLYQGLAFYYAKNGKKTAYLDAGKLFTQSMSLEKVSAKEGKNLLNRLKDVPILFLTKFGEEYPSSRFLTETLFPFLSGRKKDGFVTYFSSVYSTDDYVSRFKTVYKNRNLLANLFVSLSDEKSLVDVNW